MIDSPPVGASDVAVPPAPHHAPTFLADLADLTKVRITLVVTLSVATGYLAFAGRFDPGVLLPAFGVFVLACGAAALNEVQDLRFDARMRRTADRPIPAGRLSKELALFIALALIGAGLTMLASVPNHTLEVLGLGVLALVWYNGVYLFLKRRTALAVVPGSLVGAIPPVIGWAAAGGLPLDPRILEVAAFFFIWQIPHFWLLVLLYGPDYAQAGLPSLTQQVSARQLGRITFAWTLTLAAAGIALTMRMPLDLPWNAVMVVASVALVLSSTRVLGHADDRPTIVALFVRINLYAFAMMLSLAGSALT